MGGLYKVRDAHLATKLVLQLHQGINLFPKEFAHLRINGNIFIFQLLNQQSKGQWCLLHCSVAVLGNSISFAHRHTQCNAIKCIRTSMRGICTLVANPPFSNPALLSAQRDTASRASR